MVQSATTKPVAMCSQAKMIWTKKALTRGFKDASRPGTVLMARINFGLAAILAKLGAEANWPALLRTD